jgi:hypothetical protein
MVLAWWVLCADVLNVLLPHLDAVLVEPVFEESGVVCIVARTRDEIAVRCPACGTPSLRINLWYERSLADAPVGGRCVKILLSIRHLFCDDPGCGRRTFAEQVPDLTFRHGRRTVPERVAVTAIGVALAGRAGARLGAVLQMAVSRVTLLRLVMALPDPTWHRLEAPPVGRNIHTPGLIGRVERASRPEQLTGVAAGRAVVGARDQVEAVDKEVRVYGAAHGWPRAGGDQQRAD